MNGFFVLDPAAIANISEEFSGYIILYKKSGDEKIEKIQMDLFEKLISNGLKLKMENFMFIDIQAQRVRISALKKTISLKKCLLFGVREEEAGINFNVPLYQLIHISGIDFLRSDAPEILEQNKNLKNKLWTQLQVAFKTNE